MGLEIEPLKLSAALGRLAAGSKAEMPDAAAPAFEKLLAGALRSVDQAQVQAEDLARRFQAGEAGASLEEAMIAMQKANISLQVLVQARNRLVSAYHDVMNMTV
ncbi:MAG: flagellar hook-basal body complex protein FliE [Burkholderiales bacterium]|nr:flagellar hook-basal body complex protein FliE [Burkholderiales bacterium]